MVLRTTEPVSGGEGGGGEGGGGREGGRCAKDNK